VQSPDDTRQELTAQIDELLNTLSNKFSGVSSEIFAKSKSNLWIAGTCETVLTNVAYEVDEMSRRLDNLEAQLKTNTETTSGST
jgi:heat shock factor-binding protein 1